MILKQVLGTLLELIPVVGDVVDNVKSQDGGVGRFLTPRFLKQMVRVIVVIAAVVFFLKGDISIEQFEEFTK